MGMTLLDPDTPVNTTREDSCQHKLPTYYIILIIGCHGCTQEKSCDQLAVSSVLGPRSRLNFWDSRTNGEFKYPSDLSVHRRVLATRYSWN